ncbi:flagellar hook-length control protein FliK, partial [Devosia sp.]|uniref:flagellar hook-length control protein FliK n=1 Tax=Devosia sp. TaxID=1871048 RepID=UPI0035AD8E6E
ALPAAALTAPAPAAPEAIRPAAPSASAPAQAGGRPVVASALPSSTVTVAAATTPVALPSAAEPARPGSAAPLLQPGVATVPRPPTGPAPQAPVASPSAPLNLADLGQVAARQDSMAPLLARLAGALAQGALPRPAVEAAVGLLARRIDLNRAPPAGTVLRDAVLASGVLADAAGSRPGVRDSLLQLRAGLLAVLGHDADATVPEARRAAMPLRGESPRAAPAQAPASSGQALPELARNLLGHADAALSRLKLMQVASQPPESIRADAQPARPELRVEIPLLLGAETAMLHLQVERDARHRPTRRERAWRMRFAVHFSATGEVGAEVALFGRTANISVWAAEAETAEAIEAMLPELSPALARHGLDVGAVRVRRGVPAARPHHPGQLVDSAR